MLKSKIRFLFCSVKTKYLCLGSKIWDISKHWPTLSRTIAPTKVLT